MKANIYLPQFINNLQSLIIWEQHNKPKYKIIVTHERSTGEREEYETTGTNLLFMFLNRVDRNYEPKRAEYNTSIIDGYEQLSEITSYFSDYYNTLTKTVTKVRYQKIEE